MYPEEPRTFWKRSSALGTKTSLRRIAMPPVEVAKGSGKAAPHLSILLPGANSKPKSGTPDIHECNVPASTAELFGHLEPFDNVVEAVESFPQCPAPICGLS